MHSVLRCAALAAALILWSPAPAPGQPVFGPGQDPLAGAQVLAGKGCTKCHAVNGVGGKIGPDLGRVPRPRSFYDLATAMWNHLPRMAERMKQLGVERPKLDERDTRDLLAYLYTLSYFDAAGNREAGRKLFTDKHCAACHQAGGPGATVGPALDSLKQFGPIYVAATLWNHGPAMADAMKEKGIERPTLTGTELRDLIAYLAPRTTGAPMPGTVYVLAGRAEAGRQLFAEKQCVACHTAGGVGGAVAPELVDRLARRSPIEFAAAMWNKMPAMVAAQKARGIAVPQLRAEEMADITAYLYSVRYFAEPGSISNGWAVATRKGCLTCHSVFGERGKPASDLTRAKGLDSPAAVIAALWNHAVVTVPAPGATRAAWPEFRPAEMTDLVALLQSIARK